MKKLIMFLLCVSLLVTSAYAASLTSVEINQVLQLGNDLYVMFHANDENGFAVQSISEESLSLEVGGKILETEVMPQNEMGIGYVFAVDVSASLTAEQFAAVQEQMKAWASRLGSEDRMAIVTFGDAVTTVTDFTRNANTINAIVDGLAPTNQTTMLYSGVLRAIDLATRQSDDLPERRAVVLLSDGMNDTVNGAVGMQEMRDKAVEAGVPLYIAGVVGDNNLDSLSRIGEMARSTGGAIYTGGKDDLGQCFEKLSAYIGEGYTAKAVIPAELADGSPKGLMLTVTLDGISAMDNADVRMRVVEEAATAEPSPTPTEEPVETPEVNEADMLATEAPLETVPPTTEPAASKTWSDFFKAHDKVIYICAFAVLVAAVVLGLVLSRKKKKQKNVPTQEQKRTPAEPSGPAPEALTDIRSTQNDILVFTDEREGKSYSCELKDRVSIGRMTDNDVIINDSQVGRYQCEIIHSQNVFYLRDKNSSNGTYLIVNGKKQRVDSISGLEIQYGDYIEIGKTRLLFSDR